MLIGIVIGTLSSIMFAAQLLLLLGVNKQDLMPKARDLSRARAPAVGSKGSVAGAPWRRPRHRAASFKRCALCGRDKVRCLQGNTDRAQRSAGVRCGAIARDHRIADLDVGGDDVAGL